MDSGGTPQSCENSDPPPDDRRLASEGGEDTLQLLAYRRAWEEFGGTVQNLKFDFPS
jgi:hypothetical protein